MKLLNKKLDILLIVLAWSFVPLLVRMKGYYTGYADYEWFSDTADAQADFFLIYKSYGIVIISGIMLFLLVIYVLQKRKPYEINMMSSCLLVYIFAVLASFLFSNYKYHAWHGSYEVFEPVAAVIGYAVICFFVFQTIQTEVQVYQIIQFSSIGFLILGLIGFSQFIRHDFFETKFGKMLMVPSRAWSELDSISTVFEPGTVYGTLYNPNWVGFYTGIVLPIMIAMIIWAKRIWVKIIYMVIAVLMVICNVGSRSMSGILSSLGALFVVLLILATRNRKSMIAVCVCSVIGVIALGIFLTNTSSGAAVIQTFVGTNKGYEDFGIQQIDTNDAEVVFHLANAEELHISYYLYEDGGMTIQCLDKNGNGLPTSIDSSSQATYVVEDDNYYDCRITAIYIEDYMGIQVDIDGTAWRFTHELDDTYYYYNPVGKFVKIKPIKDAGIFNNDGFQNRGVIWNHTIPLLGQSILFGTGANTFTQVYPQTDYIYKEYRGMQYMYDVKPHNWYLQLWLEEGLIALLALLTLYGIYLVDFIKLYRKTDIKDPIVFTGIAIFTGVTAYMIHALANDSSVNTATLFWVAMGLGYAVNKKIVAPRLQTQTEK